MRLPPPRPVSARPVVLVAEEISPAAIEVLSAGLDVRRCDGTDRGALVAAVAEASALVVHRETRVDAGVVAAGGRLKVVANVGPGPGGVDVTATARAGVMVVSARTARTVSLAELTVDLLVSAARHAPPDVRLEGKVLGVVGLGACGAMVAERMRAFGMRVVGWDPDPEHHRTARPHIALLPLEDLLESADFIAVQFRAAGLIGRAALNRVRPTVRMVYSAADGVVDEEALRAAVEEGRVAFGVGVHVGEPRGGEVAVAESVRHLLAGEITPGRWN
ncbi:NAD(P)-dependent oxidoreductase [Actinomadura sp. NTSP31]|uniref:NAD(P)-dependent oxidoreductase n=1 Tax=Actinomadura sp. NTSP31 TaxID=1735447 RepID=UPI0035BF24B6